MKLTVTPNNTGTCKMRTIHLIAVKLITLIGVCVRPLVQWNLSKADTIGTQVSVLYREVSLIQRLIGTQLYVVGTADSVLLKGSTL